MTKADTARDLGYGDDIAAMSMAHDATHGWLTMSLGIPSYSLKDARGEKLTDRERRLAILEEVAVLAVQKLRQHHRL